MTVEQGLAFLKAHQPMPDDTELSEALVRAYDDVRRLCIDHPDARCIPLFLTSFGDGDGCGVYQLVEDVLRHFSLETVVPHLRKGLTHWRRSMRYWNADIAANFPTAALIEPLAHLLREDDEDIRSAAAIALGQIRDARAEGLLRNALANESKPQVVSLFQKLLNTNYSPAAHSQVLRLCRSPAILIAEAAPTAASPQRGSEQGPRRSARTCPASPPRPLCEDSCGRVSRGLL